MCSNYRLRRRISYEFHVGENDPIFVHLGLNGRVNFELFFFYDSFPGHIRKGIASLYV